MAQNALHRVPLSLFLMKYLRRGSKAQTSRRRLSGPDGAGGGLGQPAPPVPVSLPGVGLLPPVHIWSSGLFLSGSWAGSEARLCSSEGLRPSVTRSLMSLSDLHQRCRCPRAGWGLQDHGDQNSRNDGEPGDRPKVVPKRPLPPFE